MKHFILFLVLNFVPALSIASPCLDRKDVSAVMSDLDFEVDGRPLAISSLDLCGKPSLATKTLAALIFLKRSAELPALRQDILGGNAWVYFASRIRRISLTRNGLGLCGRDSENLGTAAYFDPDDAPATMHVCRFFASMDTVAAAAVLVHEARHTEGFGHVDCTRGPYKNEIGSCDRTFEEKGSYATEVEFNLRLSRHPKVDPILRQSSRLEAATQLFTRFNENSLGLKEVALLQDDRGALFAFDGHAFEAVGVGTPHQVMVNRQGEATLFDPLIGSVKTYSLGALSEADGWLAEKFHEEIGRHPGFVDALYASDYQCLLFQKELRCGPLGGPGFDFRLRLSRASPIGFIYQSEAGLVREKVPYLVGDDGALYALPKTHRALLKVKETDLRRVVPPRSYTRLAALSISIQGEYILGADGQLVRFQEYDNGQREFKKIPAPHDRKWKAIVSPVVWSKDLWRL